MTTWAKRLEEAQEDPFGNEKSLNGMPHPKWWPQWTNYKGAVRVEESFGFPNLSWWELEKGKLFWKMPKMKELEEFSAPTAEMLLPGRFPRIDEIGDQWLKASTSGNARECENVLEKMAYFWDNNYKLFEPYLVVNCQPQLVFFGVGFRGFESIFGSDSNFFKKPLNYYPPKWLFMVVFSLLVSIVHKIKHYPATPFIPWLSNNFSNDRLFSEKSEFQFPIIDWIKNKNEAQISNLARSLRGKEANFWTSVGKVEGPFDAFITFRKFYESGSFSNLSNEAIYFIFVGPFRAFYADMIEFVRKFQKVFPLDSQMRELSKPNSIYQNPYVNLRSSTDFILWSMMVMYLDMKKSPLWESFQKIPIVDNNYRWFFLDRLEAFNKDDQLTRERQLAADWDKAHPPGIVNNLPGPARVDTIEEVMGNVDQSQESIDRYGPIIKVNDIIGNNSNLNRYLNYFRIKWRETATYSFFGINKAPWFETNPPVQFLPITLPEDSFEDRFYQFIQDYPPRRLYVPKLKLSGRLDKEWEEGFQKQFRDYVTWVKENVNAKGKPNYVEPGVQFKDKEGNLVFIKDDDSGKNVPLLNGYPDYMMEPESNNSPFSVAKIVSILMIPANEAGNFLWGQDWTNALNNFASVLWEKVKEFLRAVWDALPEGTGGYLMMGLVVVGVVLGGWTFADEEIRKLAR